MRILHLLASPFWSGPAENVALLALAQRALGHEVTVAVDRLRTEMPAEEPAVPRIAALDLLDKGGLELSAKSGPGAVWRDVRLLKRRAVDVVHSHFSHDHLVAWLGRPRGARLVRSIHAPRSIRRLMPPADAFTVPSFDDARRLLGQRVLVLPPLVDPSFVPPPDRRALQSSLQIEGAPVIGMVSTFQPSRRHDLGITAFSRLRERLPEARLVLVGDGALEGTIRAQVEREGLAPAVTFAGYQSGEDFVRWLQSLDVLWVLGLGNDWSGRIAAQARACGVRVVAVDQGGLGRFADVLVEPDPAKIAAASRQVPARAIPLATNEETAADVLRLYGTKQITSSR